MKWISLIVSIIVGVMAFKYFVLDRYHPQADSPSGIAGVFVEAALKGDDAQVRKLCESGATAQALQAAHDLAKLSFPKPLAWQSMKPSSGDKAVAAQLAGTGKILLVELRKHANAFSVCQVTLSDF